MQITELIAKIKQQQTAMGYRRLILGNKFYRLRYIREISLALQKEVSEFLDEIPWKPWRAL